ncbi:galectin-4-like [Oncorhynchus kisutch]|uniref:Galectin n=1 Tax=Oncorhynchus kisutch TaxID=8019 RepID=A0A8C7DQY1_ONCKI|nr:galectin-4-like [Oncorhynchus kisutch]
MFVAPPGYQPVYNPSIPYVGPIYGGLRSGMSVYIQGVIPDEITRFNMNLQCGESEGSDIGFHFSPRFDNWDKVVFNSCQEGEWGSEEEIHNMPFSKGDAFEMVIIINQEGYQVTVNGQDLHTFNHRIPVERVNALQIGGDASIQTVNVIGGGNPAGDQIGGNLPVMDGQPIFNPPVPYTIVIPGGMSTKKTIVIRGMVPLGANRFSINFKVGSSGDIAFHLNPRVQERELVRNSFIGGSWETEEREISINPFLEGQYFDMSVRCGNQRFKVFVNGQHMCDFFHRFQNYNQIDTVELEGDVQISYVHF